MTTGSVFVDTFFWLALVNPNDAWHDRAVRWAEEVDRRLITTEVVLLEVADALCARRHRQWAVDLVSAIRDGEEATTVAVDTRLFTRGFDLYREREDKNWSLTDCISFVVMSEREIREALTGDVNFTQAGFRALLRDGT